MASRRAAFVLAALFGFRLVAVGGALVCTAHGSHAHVTEAGHHGDGPGHDEDSRQAPCNTPDSDCCAAMASCSADLVSGTVVAAAAPFPDYDGGVRQPNSSSLSRPHSPDPPPPKS